MRDDAAQHRDAVVPFARIFVGELGAAPVAAASGVRAKRAARIPLPTCAPSRWSVFAQSHQLRRVEQVGPSLLHGDFDLHRRRDVAILVEHAVSTRRAFPSRAMRANRCVLASHLETVLTTFGGGLRVVQPAAVT